MTRVIEIRNNTFSPVFVVRSFEELLKTLVRHERFYLLEQPGGSWRPVYWCQSLKRFMDCTGHVPSVTGDARVQYWVGRPSAPTRSGEVSADFRSIFQQALEEGSIWFEFFKNNRLVRFFIIRDSCALDFATREARGVLERSIQADFSTWDKTAEEPVVPPSVPRAGLTLSIFDRIARRESILVGYDVIAYPYLKLPIGLAALLPKTPLPATLRFVQTQSGCYLGEGFASTVNDLLRACVEHRQTTFVHADKAYTIKPTRFVYEHLAEMMRYLYS